MLPVVAIIGQPNVGKSTLFNCLTKSRQALVHDMPGVTRDRAYGEGKVGNFPYIVIDTGGITGGEEGMDTLMAGQSWQAVKESDVVIFLVDGRAGVTPNDQYIAQKLRQEKKQVFLVVNKTDGLDETTVATEFYELGLGVPYPIAASHGHGVRKLIVDEIKPLFVQEDDETAEKPDTGIKLAIVGKPNVGKSTLVNRMLGEERVVVFDQPGTTRDSIAIPLEREGQRYTIIDTAGVRRRKNIDEVVEKFSVVKTLKAIEHADVVLFMIDAREGISEQDMSLLGFVLETGRALVVAINKWDGMDEDEREKVKSDFKRRLYFVDFARHYLISALHGTNVGHLFEGVNEAYANATRKLSASKLTGILEDALEAHQPPMVRGRRIKLRYAHAGGQLPPVVVIHGNQTDDIPESYKRYLTNHFRKALKLIGTPLRFTFKSGENPYEGRKNILTERQVKKRKRLKNHIKSKSRK